MKDKDIDHVPEDVELSGITVDDIIKEFHTPVETGPVPEERSADESVPRDPDGPSADEPEESAPAEGAAELPPDASDTAIAARDFESGDGESVGDGQPENVRGEDPPTETKKKKSARRKKGTGGSKRPGFLSGKVIAVILTSLVSVVLLGIAVVPDLPDPFWSFFVISAVMTGFVPLTVWTVLHFRDRSRHMPPAVMLLALLITVVGHELVKAAFGAAIFDVLYAVYIGLADRMLGTAMDRLHKRLDGLDPSRDRRLETCLDELENGRIKALGELRNAERLILIGTFAFAALFTVLPGLINGGAFAVWLARSAVIVAVCACGGELAALVSYAGAVDGAFSDGVWIAGVGTVSACADITSVIFNKSGTLTDGEYRISNVDPVRISEEQLLYLAVQAGAYSEHPLNKVIRRDSGVVPEKSRITRQRVEIGYGSLVQMDDGTLIGIGNIDFMEKLGVKGNLFVPGETCVFVCVDRVCVGRISFSDTVRPDALNIAHDLRKAGVPNIAFMTGDNALTATNIGRRLDIAEVYSDCRPIDKVERLQYIQDTQDPKDRTAFVARAGNESEILELANISATLGVGDDSTAAYPDIILSTGELGGFPRLLRDARQVRGNITLGFYITCVVRLITALLGIVGVFPIWAASILMPAMSIYLLHRAEIRVG